MTFTPVLIVLLLLDAALLIFAVRRPWIALVILLAGLPFNGVLLDVVGPAVGLVPPDSPNRLALAGWHDAVAIGIVLAGGIAALKARRVQFGLVATLAVVVMVWGLVALVLAPNLVAAAYSYRTLFVPVAVMVSVIVLASTGSMPTQLPTRAGTAIVASATVAAAYAFWQVYVGGYGYLMTWFQGPSGTLPAAYSSFGVSQPRAIGTLHSPNEFGAFLVIAGLITVAPAIISFGRWRAWVAVLLGAALLLTFSRSAWVGSIIGVTTLVLMLGWRSRLSAARRGMKALAAPALVFAVACGVILTTSNGAGFIYATLTGNEPSAVVRIGAIGDAIGGTRTTPAPRATDEPESSPGEEPTPQTGERIEVTPLGGGLGTAGPKSARFSGAEPVRHSEIWYLNYAAQVGHVGVALTLMLMAAILVELWRARRRPWPAVATAMILALGAGAVFIPVIDEPAVAGPFWAVIGIALAQARNGPVSSPALTGQAAVPE